MRVALNEEALLTSSMFDSSHVLNSAVVVRLELL